MQARSAGILIVFLIMMGFTQASVAGFQWSPAPEGLDIIDFPKPTDDEGVAFTLRNPISIAGEARRVLLSNEHYGPLGEYIASEFTECWLELTSAVHYPRAISEGTTLSIASVHISKESGVFDGEQAKFEIVSHNPLIASQMSCQSFLWQGSDFFTRAPTVNELSCILNVWIKIPLGVETNPPLACKYKR